MCPAATDASHRIELESTCQCLLQYVLYENSMIFFRGSFGNHWTHFIACVLFRSAVCWLSNCVYFFYSYFFRFSLVPFNSRLLAWLFVALQMFDFIRQVTHLHHFSLLRLKYSDDRFFVWFGLILFLTAWKSAQNLNLMTIIWNYIVVQTTIKWANICFCFCLVCSFKRARFAFGN